MWEMDPRGICGVGGNNGKTGDGFIDRSKVRILLCDNDSKGAGEVFSLLCRCSYQVISVKSPRQVIDALNAEGPNIDIILSEVDLPMAKGLKMLKYIMRKELRRIPVIMMSAQDEVTLVVKCLRLGAADYLVKPLRTNELLNLWTHMWRRRRMLGLAEKKMMNYEFDLVHSDPSDANTNSTMFSDDTDEKSRKSANPEMSVSIHRGDEINAILASSPVDKQHVSLSNDRSNLPKIDRVDMFTGQIMSGPKKSELKIGQSSAFFTYVKSSISRRPTPGVPVSIDESTPPPSRIHEEPSFRDREADSLNARPIEKKVRPSGEHAAVSDTHENLSVDESSIQRNSKMEEFPERNNNSNPDVSCFNPHSGYPYYLHGPVNMMTSSTYQNNTGDFHSHANNTSILPPYNHVAQYPAHHMPGMTSFPYYPVNLCQMQPWPPYGSPSSNDGKAPTVDRREAALLKFRQKRKERCFDKKIRYVNRKKLAEKRPRVRGQFVRKVNGIDVDLNGHPTSTDFDDEDEYEEEDQASRDYSPERF